MGLATGPSPKTARSPVGAQVSHLNRERIKKVATASTVATFFYGVLMAVNVKSEVLVLHLLVLAVGADFGDGGVEFVRQLFITLAHSDAGAAAEVLGVFIGRAYEGEAFTGVGFQEAVVQVDR